MGQVFIVISHHLGNRNQFCGRQFFHGLGIIQVHCIYCALYFYFVAISRYYALTLGVRVHTPMRI